MTLSAIDNLLFNSTITHQRRTETVDDIGDSSQSLSNLTIDIPASIQPVRIDEYQEPQGLNYQGMYKVYSNVASFTSNPPKNDDYIVDQANSEVYRIIAILDNNTNQFAHHYKFIAKKEEVNS